MLSDVLPLDLDLVICGVAAGHTSARVGRYYAGPGNQFWQTLHVVGLTPRRLHPSEFALLPVYGIGLTDLVKDQQGGDREIRFSGTGRAAFAHRIRACRPRFLSFNGKRAAQEYLGRKVVEFGLQRETIDATRLFIAPSTSGAARGYWDVQIWHDLAALVRRR